MMVDTFLLFALAAGIGVALAAGPLGCFVVWRRMAYFGDATSHAAILGVAFALLLNTPIILGILVAAIGMALAVALQRESFLAMDTLLGVAAHAALATGLVIVSLVPGRPIELESYLFGDILSLTPTDIAITWVGVLAVLGVLIWRWNALLLATLNYDLASAEGLKPDRERLILSLTLAVLVAVSIKVVGALLITAMLIIPAASARTLSQTPEKMALFAAGFGGFAVYCGLYMSATLDTPAGPSIVTVAAITFALLQGLRLKR
jgi:zinc transport system permease protein